MNNRHGINLSKSPIIQEKLLKNMMPINDRKSNTFLSKKLQIRADSITKSSVIDNSSVLNSESFEYQSDIKFKVKKSVEKTNNFDLSNLKEANQRKFLKNSSHLISPKSNPPGIATSKNLEEELKNKNSIFGDEKVIRFTKIENQNYSETKIASCQTKNSDTPKMVQAIVNEFQLSDIDIKKLLPSRKLIGLSATPMRRESISENDIPNLVENNFDVRQKTPNQRSSLKLNSEIRPKISTQRKSLTQTQITPKEVSNSKIILKRKKEEIFEQKLDSRALTQAKIRKNNSDEKITKPDGFFLDIGLNLPISIQKYQDDLDLTHIENRRLLLKVSARTNDHKNSLVKIPVLQFQKFKAQGIKKDSLPKKEPTISECFQSPSKKENCFPDLSIIEFINRSLAKIPPVFSASVEFFKTSLTFLIASNSHQGKTRDYNEDRVCVTTNIADFIRRKKNSALTTSLNQMESFGIFSIFDGHGSSLCSQYLFEKLHNSILDSFFPDFTQLAFSIDNLYKEADLNFKKLIEKNNHNFSGSCACTVILVNQNLYAINLGDSRAIVSFDSGNTIHSLTEDQKPSKKSEFERILKSGGQVYRTTWNVKKKISLEQKFTAFDELVNAEKLDRKKKDIEVGPWRINPGGISVSRCFGDFESKCLEFGGTPGVLINQPIVTNISIKHADFLIIGCHLKS